MQQISLLLQKPIEVKPANERGDLLKYFAAKISKPIGYIAFRLKGFTLEDMYYLKSLADQEERRGEPWSKIFYGSIKPKV